MKGYNRIILIISAVWFALLLVSILCILTLSTEKRDTGYLVEINRLHNAMELEGIFTETILTEPVYIKHIDYIEIEQDYAIESKDINGISNPEEVFFRGYDLSDEYEFVINPFKVKGELKGFVRYSYVIGTRKLRQRLITIVIGILCVIYAIALTGLLYIKNKILKPFNDISKFPYELAKGNLPSELKESKSRYFGKFIWGLILLRESLAKRREMELKLEMDKKLMVLSISHDIKTPLSTIKLYAKAIYEGLYDSEDKLQHAARLIEEQSDKLNNFVADIIKASSTDLFEFEVISKEFYLHTLIEKIHQAYIEKLRLLKTSFIIEPYLDNLLIGDEDKLVEVFDNIMQNAIKYGDGKSITISFEEEDNCQLIKVINSGIPVKQTDFIHMFDSFWRGENAHGKQGSGLGLYICRQLLIKMNGEIYAEAGDTTMTFVVVINKC